MDEIQALRRTLRDLVALSTLPAVWAGRSPREMAEGLADAVSTAVRPELVYLSFAGFSEAARIEVAFVSGRRLPAGRAQRIGQTLAPYLASPTGLLPLIVPHPAGSGVLRALVMPIGLEAAGGVIVVGSEQPGFPTEGEYVLLSVAANQAVIWSQEVRLIGELNAREEALRRQQMELEQRVFERTGELQALTTRLQDIREEERTRVAREIHDELGGELTGLKMEIARLRKEKAERDPKLASRLDTMAQLVDRTIQTVRRIATELRPAILDDFGLLPTIEWQLQEFESRSGIACQLKASAEEIELDPEHATAVFRILQEALTNVARHAGASRVEARLERQAGDLVLEIWDNGRGITPDERVGSRSLGILGMHERVRLLSGELVINGTPGAGTSVLVRIPIERKRDCDSGGA